MKCRHCLETLTHAFADLGCAPPSNAYVNQNQLQAPEIWYPLKVYICEYCWLAQTEDYTYREELFSSDYAYFSSYSTSWLEHSQAYVAEVIKRFNLGKDSLVGEIAANDGYLLQYFQEQNIPCFGVEPTVSTANVARQKGLNIVESFFGKELSVTLAKQNYSADLLIANNVLAHVPDINDFVAGFNLLLKPNGVATFEFPHLYQLVSQLQFDTIYHEHFCYLSLHAVRTIFENNGLRIFDVEELKTHGGSLRVFAERIDTGKYDVNHRVNQLLQIEKDKGLLDLSFYKTFQDYLENIKMQFLSFLLHAKSKNQKVVGYGAAAKGNTLLNFCGVRPDLISYVVDKNPAKQGKYLPGSRIPIVSEEKLKNDPPHWIIIFPWNIKTEISEQLAYIKKAGTQFVTAIPSLAIF